LLFGPEDLVLVRESDRAQGGGLGHACDFLHVRIAALLGLLVVADAHEHRMAELAVPGPLLVADLDDDRRIRPDVLPALRHGPGRRGSIAPPRVEPLAERAELAIVEAGSDATRVAISVSVPDGQMERAEARPSALRLGESDDDEVAH